MKKSNVTKTRKLNLCTSCEICSAVCPVEAIKMEYKFGQFLPKVDDEKCEKCKLCLELCPGIDIDYLMLRHEKDSNNIFYGPCLESYTAYSNDFKIRKNSTSGGLVTNLILELIKNKEFDAAFVLDFDKFDGKPVRLKARSNTNEILNAAKSKYLPASVYNVIKTLKKGDNKKYIITGIPCQIYGIKKFVNKFKIYDENLLFLGLFCDKIFNFNIIRYFEDAYRILNEKLIKFDFRTKEKYGWPGNSKMYFDSGREIIVDRVARMQLKKFFQLNRCLFCVDKLNKLADISFGDCYIEGKSGFYGKSSVIIRTKKGEEVFGRYLYLFTMEKESIEEIRESQHLMDKKDNLEYVKIFIKRYNIYFNSILNYKINSKFDKKMLKLQKYINWGTNYNINKIIFNKYLIKIKNKLFYLYNYIKKLIIIEVIFIEGLIIFFLNKKKYIFNKLDRKNIIIMGGEFSNKGAQAMTFTAVDQVRRRFPNKKIYLFAPIYLFSQKDLEGIYKFDILPWDIRIKTRLLGFCNKLFIKNSKDRYLEKNIDKIIKNTIFIIDINGYSLSSQFGTFNSIDYLLNIIIAKKYIIPYYILPQSIGPFNYSKKAKIILLILIKIYLKYPIKIFIREKESKKYLYKLNSNNVIKSCDIVLKNKIYNLSNIYNKKINFKRIKIENKSICIIPNLRIVEQTNINKILSIYKSIIDKLINANKIIYILKYSNEDINISENIKDLFYNNRNIKLISNNLNAIELENTIKQFDFVIASRYHSVIHSYKNGVPALVIGWAKKYFELLSEFSQLDYLFDVRNYIDIDKIKRKLDRMLTNYEYERKKIIKKMNKLEEEESIFDILD